MDLLFNRLGTNRHFAEIKSKTELEILMIAFCICLDPFMYSLGWVTPTFAKYGIESKGEK